MTVVIGLLHGATFLSNLTLVLVVSFIKPKQLEHISSEHQNILVWKNILREHLNTLIGTQFFKPFIKIIWRTNVRLN